MDCIHVAPGGGLCPACQADYDYDPDSYLEYGDHPEGLANWRRLQEEIAAYAAKPQIPPDPDLPF